MVSNIPYQFWYTGSYKYKFTMVAKITTIMLKALHSLHINTSVHFLHYSNSIYIVLI